MKVLKDALGRILNCTIGGNKKILKWIPMGFKTEWTVSGDATARTITLPLYNSGVFNCTVKWGDGTPDSTVTAYNDANRAHTYVVDGTYEVEILGECPAWSFNNGGDKLKLSDIIYWGDSNEFGGFQYLTGGFYGCTNCKSMGTGKILSKSGLTDLKELFRGVNNVLFTTILSGIFDNCIYLATNGFQNTFFNCSNLTSIPVDLFKYNVNVSSRGFFGTFSGCSGLSSIPVDTFKYNTSVSAYGFSSTFTNCSGLTSIPADLFRYNTLVSTQGFNSTFSGCSGLTGAIPVDLFRYNTLVSSYGFYFTFYNCSNLTSIPVDLFRYNTALSDNGFTNTFMNCSGLTGDIPVDLFRYNILVSSNAFNSTFSGCPGLTSIPTDLFRYNTAASTNAFNSTFQGCTGITSVPVDLFRYNTLVSTGAFASTFSDCTNLASVPVDLFRYNTLASTGAFASTFSGCSKLQLNKNIFFADGEESTRFLNKSVNFSNCFNRASFTGSQGEAPHLWDCDFGTGTPVKTDCFNGAGNSLTSISNYGDIPVAWI